MDPLRALHGGRPSPAPAGDVRTGRRLRARRGAGDRGRDPGLQLRRGPGIAALRAFHGPRPLRQARVHVDQGPDRGVRRHGEEVRPPRAARARRRTRHGGDRFRHARRPERAGRRRSRRRLRSPVLQLRRQPPPRAQGAGPSDRQAGERGHGLRRLRRTDLRRGASDPEPAGWPSRARSVIKPTPADPAREPCVSRSCPPPCCPSPAPQSPPRSGPTSSRRSCSSWTVTSTSPTGCTPSRSAARWTTSARPRRAATSTTPGRSRAGSTRPSSRSSRRPPTKHAASRRRSPMR